jgi:hypothetical protein
MAWMGAIMSASGFTYCYLMFFAFGAYYLQAFGFGEAQLKLTMEIGFVVLVPGILFSGFAITLDSWHRAFREGGFLNYGTAVYNTWAQYHNTMSAVNGFGDALSDIFKNLKGGDDDNGSAALGIFCLIIVITAASLGIITTVVAIKKLSASHPLPEYQPAR